jgi:HEAT repeat protein
VEGLLRALEDDEPAVRFIAMEHLGRLGDRRAAAPLARLLDTNRWSVRARVIRTLGSIACPESIAALSGVLADDDSATVRLEAAIALGHQGRGAISALREAVSDDDDADVRAAACRSLRRISGGDANTLPVSCRQANVTE